MIQDIMKDLEEPKKGVFPHQSCERILKNKDQFTPALLDSLKNAQKYPNSVGDSWQPLFSAYFLSYFREKKSFPIILKMMSVPDIESDSIFAGEVLTEDCPRMIASVYDGSLPQLKHHIEDTKIDIWSRSAALDSLVYLYAWGSISGNHLVDYLRECLTKGLLEGKYLYSGIASIVEDLEAYDLKKATLEAFDSGLIDISIIGKSDIERLSPNHPLVSPQKIKAKNFMKLIGRISEEIGCWPYFSS